MPKAGFELKCLQVAGMVRGKSLSAIKKNVGTVVQTAKAVSACKKRVQRAKETLQRKIDKQLLSDVEDLKVCVFRLERELKNVFRLLNKIKKCE